MAFKSTWTPPLRARDKPIPEEPPRLSGGFTYSASGGVAVPKAEKADPRGEQAHKDKLAALGCMVCRRLFPGIAPGPVELHHLRTGGWGKGDHTTLMPLCTYHHRGDGGVHGLGTRGFVKRYGFTQADLLMDALTLVGQKT